MSTQLIPRATKIAAKRGFIRTAAQSLSAAIPTAAIVVTLTGSALQAAGLGILSALVTAGLAGAASYLSILSKGIPEDYQATPSPLDESL